MYSQRVKNIMDEQNLLLVTPETTVREAAAMMAGSNVGAVLVINNRQNKQLVGIFTERDVVFRIVGPGLDPASATVGEFMTTAPQSISPDESYGYALLLMHEHHFRHMPVLADGVPVGIVSSRNALDPDMEEFVSERQRRINIRPVTA
jgi:CBS domain-containing protein